MAGNVPIRESVGAALRFSRENVRFIALVAGAGALATTAFSGLAMAAPVLGLFASLGSSLAHAAVYAALVGAFLRGPAEARGRWLADGWRVFAAMAVIGFFLFIVFFVLSIPVMIILFAGPMAPYVADLQSAAADQAAVMAVMTRFAEENPGALLAVTLFYSAVWAAADVAALSRGARERRCRTHPHLRDLEVDAGGDAAHHRRAAAAAGPGEHPVGGAWLSRRALGRSRRIQPGICRGRRHEQSGRLPILRAGGGLHQLRALFRIGSRAFELHLSRPEAGCAAAVSLSLDRLVAFG
jgi:hypothetical protein